MQCASFERWPWECVDKNFDSIYNCENRFSSSLQTTAWSPDGPFGWTPSVGSYLKRWSLE